MNNSGVRRFPKYKILKALILLIPEQFNTYLAEEFELLQSQKQAKINWIQHQQLAQDAGVEVEGMVPTVAPEMSTPPWTKTLTVLKFLWGSVRFRP